MCSPSCSHPSQPRAHLTHRGSFLRRSRTVIEALYGQLAFKCSICGLRKPSQQEIRTHLDWHYKKFKDDEKLKDKVGATFNFLRRSFARPGIRSTSPDPLQLDPSQNQSQQWYLTDKVCSSFCVRL